MNASPKPPIERYFHLPVVATPIRASPIPPLSTTPTNSKRQRTHDEAGPSAKKVNVEGYVEVEEWVGPYGI
jgi:hypothetical protein